jgi:hypothetical protein
MGPARGRTPAAQPGYSKSTANPSTGDQPKSSMPTHVSLTHHVRNTLASLALMIRSSCCAGFDGTSGFRFKRSRSQHGRLW